MHPYIPYTILPAAVIVAWFAAPYFSASEPGRYVVPRVKQIEDPSALMEARAQAVDKPDIRVQAFLPRKPPEKHKPPKPEPTLILQSVVIGDYARIATINGRTLKQGDRIEGYLVKRISANGVDLARGNKNRNLPMRALHELPPPAAPAANIAQPGSGSQADKNDLTRDFWRIFDALKP